MSFKVKIQNNRGDWYQIFPNDEVPISFIRVMKKQKATFYEDGTFECSVYEIQPLIDCIEEYIKDRTMIFFYIMGLSLCVLRYRAGPIGNTI